MSGVPARLDTSTGSIFVPSVTRQGTGDTPLVAAARNDDLQAVRALIARRANVNEHARDGSTALLWATDRDVWRYCQSNGLILLTGNRNQDDETSLEQTLCTENTEASLPVLTITDRQQLVEADYRERCIETLITIVFDLPNYLGSARQFIP